jgi:hypothetical protein
MRGLSRRAGRLGDDGAQPDRDDQLRGCGFPDLHALWSCFLRAYDALCIVGEYDNPSPPDFDGGRLGIYSGQGSGALIIRVEPADRARSPIAPADPTAALSLRDLDRALARISEEHRQVILLIGLEGTSYGEAASILDVPIGTIRSRLSHGRESLRTLMDRREGTEATSGAAITSAVPERRRFVPEVERTQFSH